MHVRHCGELAALQPNRRQGRRLAHHRCLECLQVHAHGPQHPHLGRGHLQAAGDSDEDLARDQIEFGGVWQGEGLRQAGRDSNRGCVRRPACRVAGPGVLGGWLFKEHVWHGLLHAVEHRHRGRPLAQRLADDHRFQARQREADVLRPRGLRGVRRAHRTVVAGQYGPHRGRGRDRRPRELRGRQRWRHARAGVQRPLRASLAPGCARRAGRHDPLHEERAHRARGSGIRRLQHR
mmetsp:Transcript_23603/g.67659  ORF Transcript_23603/g.67659 Transcript_23603/m.67659 type:complete len:235 (+) Transcript_23603:556-1260(+)